MKRKKRGGAKTADDSRKYVVLVFAAALTAYLLTLCPTVYGGDSGDFTTAAYTLGVPHPTGYPLYTMAGKLFTLIPTGSIAYRVNLFSAVCAALAAAVASKTVFEEGGKAAPAVLAGLSLAFSSYLWGWAVVAEVYALNALFTALALYFALRFRRGGRAGDLNLLALTCGLALTNHVSFALYMPAFALLAYGKARRRDYARVAACLMVPLLLYLYIPLRALGGAEYVWLNPDTPERLYSFLTASRYMGHVVTTDAATGFHRILEAAAAMLSDLKLAALFSLAGVYALRRDRLLMHFTAAYALIDFAYVGFLKNIPPDMTSFNLPLAILAAFYFGAGATHLAERFGNAATAFAALSVLLLLAGNYGLNDRSGNTIAYYYGLDVLKSLPENAVLFTEGDKNTFTLNYLQQAEGVRADVLLADRPGALSHAIYGEDYGSLPEAERVGRMISVEHETLKSGRPVYYTLDALSVADGVSLRQEGLVYRAFEGNASQDYGGWVDYGVESVPDGVRLDYTTKTILLTYYLRKAEQLSAEGKESEALGVYMKLPGRLGDMRRMHYLTALSHIKFDRFRQAAEELEKEPTAAEDPEVLGALCHVRMQLGDVASAKKECGKALELDPGNVLARFYLMRAEAGAGS